jgi:hypothetical protein
MNSSRRVARAWKMMKTMLITFFNIKVTIHSEFIPQGQTVSQAYYVEILKRLKEAVLRKRPELCPSDWILHHDNAPTHKGLSVKTFLTRKSITEMEHPLYIPNLTLNDFWLICLKRTKISGTGHMGKEICANHKNNSNSVSFVGGNCIAHKVTRHINKRQNYTVYTKHSGR